MTKKTLGYVELEWTCPNCDTKNPGSQKTCLGCGMAQPDDVKFEQPAQEKLVTDKAKLAQAKAGPDIQCHYCGSRNAGTATNCSQCGASLAEGAKRESGQVLGAHRDKPAEPINCPACNTSNDAGAPKCANCGASLVATKPKPRPPTIPKPKQAPAPKSKFGTFVIVGLVALALVVVAACITFFVLFTRTEDVSGTVKDVSWSRTISIEALVPVTHEDWRDEIPSEAVIGVCTEKVHHTEEHSTGETREVCGTPYTVDSGSGYGEVVQDCTTEDIKESVDIYADSCEYTVDEWQEVDQAQANGNNLAPHWPNVSLGRDQREGNRDESYQCTFSAESSQYTYQTTDQQTFNQCEIGSRWTLQINTFDVVMDIEPLR